MACCGGSDPNSTKRFLLDADQPIPPLVDEVYFRWRFYYEDTQAIIFVVDSSDLERMDEAREDLHRMLTEHELWDAPLLIMANKQDASGAMASREITEKLQLYSLANRNW